MKTKTTLFLQFALCGAMLPFARVTSATATAVILLLFVVSPSSRGDVPITSLYSFAGSDGANPWAGLIQGSDGNFYGTTYAGRASGYGTVFQITPTGTLAPLHSFTGADGANPRAALLQGTDSNFFGTTENGGRSGFGVLFGMTPSGTFTPLHSFKEL